LLRRNQQSSKRTTIDWKNILWFGNAACSLK